MERITSFEKITEYAFEYKFVCATWKTKTWKKETFASVYLHYDIIPHIQSMAPSSHHMENQKQKAPQAVYHTNKCIWLCTVSTMSATAIEKLMCHTVKIVKKK